MDIGTLMSMNIHNNRNQVAKTNKQTQTKTQQTQQTQQTAGVETSFAKELGTKNFEQRLNEAFPNDNVRVEVMHNSSDRYSFQKRGGELGPRDLSVFIPEDVMNKAASDPEYAQTLVDRIVAWKNDYDARDYADAEADGYNALTYSYTTSHAFLLNEDGQVEDFVGTSTGALPEDYQFNRSHSITGNSDEKIAQAKKLRKKKLQKMQLEELLEHQRLLQKHIDEIRLQENITNLI